MNENIGNNLMKFAKIVGCTILIIGIIAWIYFICDVETYTSSFGAFKSRLIKENDWLAWVSLISGVIGYLTSWPMYALGKLVDDVSLIKEKQVSK